MSQDGAIPPLDFDGALGDFKKGRKIRLTFRDDVASKLGLFFRMLHRDDVFILLYTKVEILETAHTAGTWARDEDRTIVIELTTNSNRESNREFFVMTMSRILEKIEHIPD